MPDHFFDGVAGGAHGNDHAVRLRMPDVIEEAIAPAGQHADPLHAFRNDGGNRPIPRIRPLPSLKINVRILCRAAQFRVLRIHRLPPERGQLFPINQLCHIFVVDHLDLLHLVGGAEAVEEVHEGYARLQRREMGDEGEVHALLHRRGAEQGEAGGGELP